MTEASYEERNIVIFNPFESDGDQIPWFGTAWPGPVGFGLVRLGRVGQDKVVCCRSGVLQQDRGGFTALVHIFNLAARLAWARLGLAGYSMADRGKARAGVTPRITIMVWRDQVRLGLAGRGWAGPGKSRRGKGGGYPPHFFHKSLQSRLVWLEHREPMSMTRK